MGNISISDIAILVIILLCIIWGAKKGFARAVLGLGSFAISIILAFVLYQPVSDFLKNSVVGEYVTVTVTKTLQGTQDSQDSENTEDEQLFNLPPEISQKVTEGINDVKTAATETLSESVSLLALNIISMLAVFLIVKLLMWLVTVFLDVLAKLPVIRTLNKTLGGVLGVIYGVLVVYIIMAVLTFVTTVKPDNAIVKDVLNSSYASKMYNNNFIVNFIGIGENGETK